MEPFGRPVRLRHGSRLVVTIVAGVLAMSLLPGCKADEELPPVFTWVWSGTAPSGITAVEACGVGGPSVIACADGSIRKADAAGATVWEIANPGLQVVSLSVDDAGSTAAVVTAAPAGTEAPAPDVLTVYGAAGNGLWQAASPAEGLSIGGTVSADGTKVLVSWPSSDDVPGNVNVRDSASGVVRWEKRTDSVLTVVCDATADFRRVVTGYSLANGDNKPTGLVEAYADDSIRTHLEMKRPVSASLIATDVAGVLDERGKLTAYELTDNGFGQRLWSKSTGRNGVMVTGAGIVAVAAYDIKGKDDTVDVTAVRVYNAEGKRLYEEEFEASVRYLPTVSSDGRFLALVPAGAAEGEVPLVIWFGEEVTTAELPPGVSAVSFEAGDGLMLVGMSDGTYGLSKLPF
jgi:hypothetical protein